MIMLEVFQILISLMVSTFVLIQPPGYIPMINIIMIKENNEALFGET